MARRPLGGWSCLWRSRAQRASIFTPTRCIPQVRREGPEGHRDRGWLRVPWERSLAGSARLAPRWGRPHYVSLWRFPPASSTSRPVDALLLFPGRFPALQAGLSAPLPPFMPPCADVGHQVLAELLAGVVLQAVERVLAAHEAVGVAGAAGGPGVGGGEPRAAELPPPMIPGNADVPTTLCAMQASAGSVSVMPVVPGGPEPIGSGSPGHRSPHGVPAESTLVAGALRPPAQRNHCAVLCALAAPPAGGLQALRPSHEGL